MSDDAKSDWHIIIAERGWVYAGRTHRDGDSLVITDAQNVRRWGTTGGLGQLALKGPTSETQLDHYGTVRIHVLAVCGTVDCDDAVWDAWHQKQAKAKR